MFDSRYYLVTISAVFLALATGILVGISYGEDYLIYSQQEVIEQLERELFDSREKGALLEKEISIWSGFQDYFWEEVYANLFKDPLSVTVLSDSIPLARETVDFMEARGIGCELIVLTPLIGLSLKEEEQHYLESNPGLDGLNGTDLLICALLGKDPGFLYHLQKEGKIEMPGAVPGTGEKFVILSEAGRLPGSFLEEAALRLKTKDCFTVAAFSLRGNYPLPDSYREWGEAVIDHLDTFWGRLALLEVIRTEATGHFGFKSNLGLFPFEKRVK